MQSLRNGFALLLLVGSFLIARPVQARTVDGDCGIETFLSQIQVNVDASADITETLNVDCGDLPGKHGIFRILPYALQNRPTTEQTLTPITLQSITDAAGNPYLYDPIYDRANQTVTWKIGSPSLTIAGVHTYVIKYHAENVIQHPAGEDLFAWNLNGNFWELTTDQFTAQIRFPANLGPDKIQVRTFSGLFGGTDTGGAQTTWIPDPANSGRQVLQVSATGTLAPKVGITLYAILPAGTFSAYRLSWLAQNGNWVWLLLVPVLVGLFYRYWRRYGQDPAQPGAQVVYFEPPGGLAPMELGLLDTYGANRPSYITATIVDLAVRGYLNITEIPKEGMFGKTDWQLQLLDKDRDQLALYEKEVLDGLSLANPGDVIKVSELKNSFYTHVPGIVELAKQPLLDQGFLDKSNSVRTGLVAVGGIFLLAWGILSAIWFRTGDPVRELRYSSLPLALIISGVAGLIFAFLMPRRTEKGAELLYQLKGFKEYMKRAEKYRAQFYEKENMFEKILPYAILFGLTERWIKATRGMMTEKQLAGLAPIWYLNPGGLTGINSLDNFSTQLTALSSQIGGSMSAPASSGGGGGFGGGFSGGGGGGGGGGSW